MGKRFRSFDSMGGEYYYMKMRRQKSMLGCIVNRFILQQRKMQCIGE